MARYIDADKFTERIKASPAFRNIYDGLLLQRVVIDLLNNIPAADVVPKSEVEELKAIITDHKANEERWQELYADTVDKWEKAYEELEMKLENAKVEVSRVIFEEIERLMENNEVYFRQTDEMQEEFAELKKKYKEDKE